MSKLASQKWTILRQPGDREFWHVMDDAGDVVGGFLTHDRARLIAAAPELLAECQSARAIFGAYLSAGYNSPGPTPENIDAAFWRLDALIAKIERDAP